MLSVREITKQDIPLVVAYWMTSAPAHLVKMGVDLSMVPSEATIRDFLLEQYELPVEKKASFATIWLLDGNPIGHCNVNQIKFGKQAFMHLHLWEFSQRKKGMGCELVKKSIPHFFKNLQLEELFCEPYALNPAPHKTLEKAGFEFVKTHTTIPGPMNFEQPVHLWRFPKHKLAGLKP